MEAEWRYRADNFSYDIIATPLRIPINQQMVVYQQIQVNDTLTILGTLVITN